MLETVKTYFPTSEPEIFTKVNTVIRFRLGDLVIWFDIYKDSCLATVNFGNYKSHTTMFSTTNEQGISLEECCKQVSGYLVELRNTINHGVDQANH